MATRQIDSRCGPLLVHEGNGLIHGRGIVYATADRFAAPTQLAEHADVVDATTRGPACPQLPSRLEFVTGPVTNALAISEHCQVLSVTAPTDADRLPVMVWFHGGAYITGSGEAVKYDADSLTTEGDVVVVNVSYRLGVFGYLNLHDRDTENLGLRDQICALRWVQDNIAAFGGDPARVTVFGQSAGGDSVVALLLCPEATGLFTRAILQSTPLSLRDGRSAMTDAMREAAAAALSGTSPTEASVRQLLDAQVAALRAAQRFGLLGGLAFAPIAGCAPLPPSDEMQSLIADAASRVEILAGYTRDDARPFVVMSPRGRRLRRLGPAGNAITVASGRATTQRVFGRPTIELVKAWTAAGGHGATYRVNWSPQGAPLGACHCIELPLLFGTPDSWSDAPMLGPEPRCVDTELAQRVRAQWSAFAHDGTAALDRASLRIA
ncbi:para-nitrobenzyl esterase [Mycolicibacterium agri]|uniref:Carboxylic ester hydrolase n=1 Tax=Mycolicibacterium agri TaxID=36811 RepID=A0A2A7MRU5_MYCAG|nr:carboxylesterase family protein [Mycolicibacterium agri]PEG34455.1 para-nitrobenzyl esterase [Mycolicibacterium agri]GFG51936.1 carboxylic ester hydrolase [Mycolicibacterium agri]